MKKRKVSEWYRFDNAAKIFPPNSNKSDTKVFRFACELVEPVDKEILQKSLNITIEEFPLYKSVIKSGVFWYYFEKSNIKPEVFEEDLPPCSPLYDKDQKTLLFRVMYYNKRISLEVYHALSDGSGALQFLKALVYHYLIIKYSEELPVNISSLDYDASGTQKVDDSFKRYYSAENKKVYKKKIKAYRIKGQKLSEYRINVIEGIIPVDIILKKVKEYNTSLTVFLAAILMISIKEEIPVRYKKKPVVLSIPVDLRNFFNSATARNFFGVINIEYSFVDNSSDLQDVINALQDRLRDKLESDYLINRINMLASLEYNYMLRVIPLSIKNIVLKIANNIVDKSYTSTLSNVGAITMPEELSRYISSFDLFVSTNKIQAAVCSYKNNLRISFTSAFVSTEIQRRFFRTLTSMGISVDIVSN